MSIVDENYRAKIEARRNGTTPVLVTAPTPGKGTSQADIDARYRAKIAARLAAPAVVVAPKPGKASAETEPDKSKTEPEAEPAKDSSDAGSREHGHGKRDRR